MKRLSAYSVLAAALALGLTTGIGHAQDDHAPGQPDGEPRDHRGGDGQGLRHDMHPDLHEGPGADGPMHGGVQLGPPGRWWDDEGFAGMLRLQPDQQTRMDKIFNDNKGTLLARFGELKHEEQLLGEQARATAVDEQQVFGAIDRVAAARAALEKAHSHMLLLLRAQLTAEQLRTLDAHRPQDPHGPQGSQAAHGQQGQR